ncbi:hypothetical protein DPMN_141150 [Dreissena polymorpha]|uniref:Uncharacterized protein n=1 Tax=Dreissena polymorpha TaxID=45954 RepID=A0A9D4G9F4_DREPO|nr:hypothetical protein DPMN_141150 [Dreissena polymorpha]
MSHMKASLCTEYRERTAMDIFELCTGTCYYHLSPIQNLNRKYKLSARSERIQSLVKILVVIVTVASDSVVQIYRIPQRRNTNTRTAVIPGPVTSISTPAISHSSPSYSTGSIPQPSQVRPNNQSVTGSHSTPVDSPLGSPLSHKSNSSSSSLTPSIHENPPPNRHVRQRRPPYRFGEWQFVQAAEYFV